MGNFNNRNKGFGGGGFRSRDSGGGRGGGNREMHQAVCSECGNDCQVPFRPTGNKPVFCSNCFEKQQDGGGSDRGRSRNKIGGSRPERSDNSNKQVLDQLAKLNEKLDAVTELLENSAVKSKAKSKKPIVTKVETVDLVEEAEVKSEDED